MRVKVFACGVISAPVVHEPPVEFVNDVHVPLWGENVPLAGPFWIDHVSVVVSPYLTVPGLAESVHVGSAAGAILTVYVPLIVCGPGLVQLSCHDTLNVHVPEEVGVPDMVASEDEQVKFNPLQLRGVH